MPNPMNVYAIIMAGGNGERFWPLSTPDNPKQFLDLFGGKPLIRHAVDRLEGLIPPERIFVITADRFVGLTQQALPTVPRSNIIGEPCRRDTAAAVATACGIVLNNGGEGAVGCILTADQLVTPVAAFQQTLSDTVEVAAQTDAILTIGITPTRPDTGFGYIETGSVHCQPQHSTPTSFFKVMRFVEKPKVEKAAQYLAAGNFLWNSGMFIWKAATMRDAYASGAPDFLPLIDTLSTSHPSHLNSHLNHIYPSLRTISVDFAVMERAPHILVARSTFTWDDVGSWSAIEHHFAADEQGNVVLGAATLQNTADTTVVNRADDGHVLAIAGLKDVVVVHTPTATLVCSKAETANMKSLVRSLN